MTNKEEKTNAGVSCPVCGEPPCRVASYCDGCFTERRSVNRDPTLFFDRCVASAGALERDCKAFAYKLAPQVRPGSGQHGVWTERDRRLGVLLGELSSRATKLVEAMRAVEGQLRSYHA